MTEQLVTFLIRNTETMLAATDAELAGMHVSRSKLESQLAELKSMLYMCDK
jgi:hypothetical protein